VRRGVRAAPLRRAFTDEGKFTTQIAPSYVENAQATGLASRKLSEDELEAVDLLEEIGLQLGFGARPTPMHKYRNVT
jgi:hypothetical protein